MSGPGPDLDVHLPGIQAADPNAFALWMTGAEPSLRRSLRTFAASVDTEAVLQEALLRAWQLAPTFEPDGKPNALLRFTQRMTRNLALSECRRFRTRAPADDEDALEALESPHVEPPDPMLRRHLHECRDKMPGKPAQALGQRMVAQGESDATLATRLGMTVNTFLQNFSRARKLLAECLKRRGVDVVQEGGARP